MTLTTTKVNREAADKSFDEKKKRLFAHPDLSIDQYIIAACTWSDKQINQRQEQLAKRAVQVWNL